MDDSRSPTAKKAWTAPRLTVYGGVTQITQQTKNKTFGSGDDVLVNSQAILSNVGPS